ncbi:PREDICTED: collagen alpha-1(I) chain-like isoform X4 [Ficedula albicollis]|uniref:collagen alpha-1(I) chain-like isoform X4 n=1 Tax=Ficedula albicollis TaxID=59894 RepID=UPI000359F6B2|nr:PREDICTED: collagen alpha-1(I) chain-like isoform X4 [Ficedula albicollis]
MDEERNSPFFPLRAQTRSTSGSALRTAPPPPRSRTIGRTDRRTVSAGREGRRGSGGQRWAPPARALPGPLGCLGILCFPCRADAEGAAAQGPLRAPAASPARLGDATSASPSAPSPAPSAPAAAGAERRGGAGRGGEKGAAPEETPAPPRPRPRLDRVLSLSSQPEAEGLFKFYFLF